MNIYIKFFFLKNFWVFIFNYWCAIQRILSHDYLKAILNLEICLRVRDRFDPSGLVFEQLGVCYYGINENEKSKAFFLKALEFYSKDEDLNSELASRLGFIFFQEEDYGKSRYYLELAKKNCKKFDFTNIKAVEDYLSLLKKYEIK